MDKNLLSTGDRFAMLIGKTVIWGSIIWIATGIIRPIIEGTNVSITFSKEKKDA